MTAIKPEQIRWRVGSVSKDKAKGMLLGYIDSRTAMELLDELSSAWSDEYRIVKVGNDEGVECALTVDGITRTDVGTPSNTEGLKGAYSDALKRAAVKHGIGRELYELPRIWVGLDNFGRPSAEPAFKSGRWVLPSGAGSVFYDHEPEAPRLAPASDSRARLAAVASAHNINAADLERIAKQVGASKPATDAQIEQIIAIIESPGSGVPIDSPAIEPRDERERVGSPADAVTPVEQPEAGVSPPSAPAADLLDTVLAATGGEVELPRPGTDQYKVLEARERAEARAYWQHKEPAGAHETAEAAEVPMGL